MKIANTDKNQVFSQPEQSSETSSAAFPCFPELEACNTSQAKTQNKDKEICL